MLMYLPQRILMPILLIVGYFKFYQTVCNSCKLDFSSFYRRYLQYTCLLAWVSVTQPLAFLTPFPFSYHSCVSNETNKMPHMRMPGLRKPSITYTKQVIRGAISSRTKGFFDLQQDSSEGFL